MDWDSTWDFFWHFLIIFAWIAYLLILVPDPHRPVLRPQDLGLGQGDLGGLPDRFPWFTALVYLIARGKGMAERAREAAAAAEGRRGLHPRGCRAFTGTGDRRCQVASGVGAISQAEFDCAEGQGSALVEDRTQDPVDQTGGSCAPCSGEIVRWRTPNR